MSARACEYNIQIGGAVLPFQKYLEVVYGFVDQKTVLESVVRGVECAIVWVSLYEIDFRRIFGYCYVVRKYHNVSNSVSVVIGVIETDHIRSVLYEGCDIVFIIVLPVIIRTIGGWNRCENHPIDLDATVSYVIKVVSTESQNVWW